MASAAAELPNAGGVSSSALQWMQPRYWHILQDPEVKVVFLTGCGGGFDFVHSMTLIPALLAMGKKLVIGSYSFGDPDAIHGESVADVWWGHPESEKGNDGGCVKVRRVDGESRPSRSYGPEVGMCQYLDLHFPNGGAAAGVSHLSGEATPPVVEMPKWTVYAYNARVFTVCQLRAFYTRLCNEHAVDVIVAVDGGSDSLMAGDEAGLGDPIEDAVTVAAIATMRDPPPPPIALPAAVVAVSLSPHQRETDDGTLKPLVPGTPIFESTFDDLTLHRPLKGKILIAIGVGCDRFNGVSDAATLRAIAELSAMTHHNNSSSGERRTRGFLGSMALEPDSALTKHYSALIEHLQGMAFFRSVIANSIVETSNGSGSFGSTVVPPSLKRRVAPGELFLWPFMSFHFAFSLPCVFARGMLGHRLLDCKSVSEMYQTFHTFRAELKAKDAIREPEGIP